MVPFFILPKPKERTSQELWITKNFVWLLKPDCFQISLPTTRFAVFANALHFPVQRIKSLRVLTGEQNLFLPERSGQNKLLSVCSREKFAIFRNRHLHLLIELPAIFQTQREKSFCQKHNRDRWKLQPIG